MRTRRLLSFLLLDNLAGTVFRRNPENIPYDVRRRGAALVTLNGKIGLDEVSPTGIFPQELIQYIQYKYDASTRS